MAFGKKSMTENEKKAKLTALKGANKAASDAMTGKLGNRKDPKSLKDHVKDMTKEAGFDFKDDSDDIIDPIHNGRVVGRKVSIENEDTQPDDTSVYDPNDLDSIEQKIQELLKLKKGR